MDNFAIRDSHRDSLRDIVRCSFARKHPNYHNIMLAEAEPRKCCFEKSSVDQHDGHAVVFVDRHHFRDPLDKQVSMVSKFSCASHVAMDSLFSTMADVSAEELD